MIGSKLYNLINDLSKKQLNNLLLKCRNSNDKRLVLFKSYLSNHVNTIANLNVFLIKEVNKTWPNSSEKEKELKVRRLTNFYTSLIEKIILEDEYLDKTSSFRNILLANFLVKKGSTDLVNHYYDKAYLKSIEENDLISQTSALKGKISMVYASQNEKKIEKVFEYNQKLAELNESIYKKSIIDYYNNISNVYLEKSSLLKGEKSKYINEIKQHISEINSPLLKSSLYVSLAKLNFENESLFVYLNESKKIMNLIAVKDKSYFDFERKLNFLELRLNFFKGKEVEELIEIADTIFTDQTKFSIINNNTLFYKILFTILADKIDDAQLLLNENHIYFKGQAKILEQFLKAIIFEKSQDYRKAIQLLQDIIYSSNYFFSIFSRLLLIKIYIQQNKISVLKSLVDSTQRYLLLNEDNPLGMESHQYVLHQLKGRYMMVKGKKELTNQRLTVFHKYLLG
jgi:hypothetical protein